MDELKARKLIYGVVNTITPTTSNNSPSTSPRTSTSIHASSSSTFTQVKNLSDLSLSSQRDLRTYSVPNQRLSLNGRQLQQRIGYFLSKKFMPTKHFANHTGAGILNDNPHCIRQFD
ncbi:hypothetical protein MJO29_004883 [Puccinia striiformis f. sp. tritici]|nr:hypothetical protein MJO29_004883 [Puccinia striiformis f. sp. tritici]KAI9609578.1 hypothetical protein H4Q26_007538 [Puccinia striiformis f. sp. tritici PST-130]